MLEDTCGSSLSAGRVRGWWRCRWKGSVQIATARSATVSGTGAGGAPFDYGNVGGAHAVEGGFTVRARAASKVHAEVAQLLRLVCVECVPRAIPASLLPRTHAKHGE